MDYRSIIQDCRACLGIELGSTRIKACLTAPGGIPIASGSYAWENLLKDGIWTYPQQSMITGLQACYAALLKDVRKKYSTGVTGLAAIGISGMMHGYLAFDESLQLLVPFRTWRNTMTAEASGKLGELFGFSIPQRFSIAHLYQAMLDGQPHIAKLDYITSLAGYIHLLLTGRRVLGACDASGMFPLDSDTKDYDKAMMTSFDAIAEQYGCAWRLRDILPAVLCAGENAGALTASGAALLDLSGQLKQGIPMCPPEGDAGTGMVATNSVRARTGNVSAGTSIFAMTVLEHPLKRAYKELDLITTPAGQPAAMVHCNNCTSDLDSWAGLMREFAQAAGFPIDTDALYDLLFGMALKGSDSGGGLLSYNYLSGEHITGFSSGCPLFLRRPDADFNLANFMRTQLYSCMSTLRIGMDILKHENVTPELLSGHGGLFKARGAAQRLMASALNVSVRISQTAGEGGAWGIALMAEYMLSSDMPLEEYLDKRIFTGQSEVTACPDSKISAGFEEFLLFYKKGLCVQRAAVNCLD